MRKRSAAIYRDVCLKWHGVIDNHREEVCRVEFPGVSLITSYPLCRMTSSAASPSLADRLLAACWNGDLSSAKAAVADGASVNEMGRAEGLYGAVLPLRAAVYSKRLEVVVWLLSVGADPNGDKVLYYCTRFSTAGILQLLIDAGGDVNRASWGRPPLIWAVQGTDSEDKVRVLLAQPSLDLTVTYKGKTPEQYARDEGRPAVADMIAREVSRCRSDYLASRFLDCVLECAG